MNREEMRERLIEAISSAAHVTAMDARDAADAVLGLVDTAVALAGERARWNIREEGNDLLICRGDHHRSEKCEWERYVPVTERDAARAEAERLREALAYYAEQFCELGSAEEACGKLDTEHCSGCLARAALAATEGKQ